MEGPRNGCWVRVRVRLGFRVRVRDLDEVVEEEVEVGRAPLVDEHRQWPQRGNGGLPGEWD